MNESEWQISFPSGNWVITHRGIRIVITRSDTGEPSEIGWFIDGQLIESVPSHDDLKGAQDLAIDKVNHRMQTDEQWQAAEKEAHQPDFY